MNRRLLALGAATVAGGLLLTAATVHHTSDDTPLEPVPADVVDWATVTGTTVHITEDDPRWDCATNCTGDTLPSGERIQEDDPRWDCRIHGNKRCGPDVAVVSAISSEHPEPEVATVSVSR